MMNRLEICDQAAFQSAQICIQIKSLQGDYLHETWVHLCTRVKHTVNAHHLLKGKICTKETERTQEGVGRWGAGGGGGGSSYKVPYPPSRRKECDRKT